MMLVGMKTCPALLWGLCVAFVVEAVTVSPPETGANSSSEQLTTVINSERATPAVTRGPTHNPAEVSAAAAAAAGGRMSHAKETEKNQTANVTTQSPRSSGSSVGFAVVSTASAQLHHILTLATATDGETQTVTAAVDGAEQSSGAPTTTRATPATPATSSSPTAVTEFRKTSVFSPTVSTQSSPSTPAAATESNIHTSEAASVSDTAIITETHVSAEPSSAPPSAASDPITSARTPGPGSAAASTSSESSTSTSALSTSAFSSSALSTSALSTSAPSTSPPSTSPPSTSDTSMSPAGIVIPKKPQPPTKPAAATTTTVSKSTPAPGVQPSPTRNVVKHCLIIIAFLALLATIFIVTTIVLGAKLSARKYRMKRHEGTEMMCISSLLPERNYTYTRQRNPISNGVLVIPRGGDSDEEGGDNVTLSSFFPENDRYV